MGEPKAFEVQLHLTVWMVGYSLTPYDFALHIGPFTFFWLREALTRGD